MRPMVWFVIWWWIIYEIPPFFSITSAMETRVSHINGAHGEFAVYWAGYPRFPVTIAGAVARCPAKVQCAAAEWTIDTRQNPVPISFHCTGPTGGWAWDYDLWMTDARGIRTQKIRVSVTCAH